MTRRTLNLSNIPWHFGQTPRRPFTDPNLYDLPAVTEWLPAAVSGNVHTDLLALGRIPDPFFGEQYKESLWVEEVDWWYRCQLSDMSRLPATAHAFLRFEGIDYLSAIFINGREMARHEGMFSHQIVEITKALPAGPVEVAVRVWGSSALPKRQLTWRQRLWQQIAQRLQNSWTGIYPDRSATLKCQMSFGWDFAPPIRTMGIWDEVSLVITGPVFIAEASVTAGVRGRGAASGFRSPVPGQTPANLTLHLTLDTAQPRQTEAVVLISPANFEGPNPGPFHFSLNLPAGRSDHRLQIDLPEVALWQPWDRGQPYLYNIKITLAEPNGEHLDEVTLRTGIRAVALHNWQFSLNGQPEFIRGLNWVPADSFPGRLGRDRYAHLLDLARRSGANLLRVWGGGLREKRAFYDLCDELGLLVWQEFPFACMFLGSYPSDPAYLARVEAECGAVVRQLRHHPSLIVWCGGNEFSPRRNRPLLDTLAALVAQHDGSRPFIPVSPSFAHGGDAHNWAVWHGSQPFRAYQSETARFLSEFGLQALPHFDTLNAALPDPTSPTAWLSHHADLPKLARYTSLFNNQPSSSIHHSQLAQATALQTAIEHMRRRKGETGGVCLWQFNEPWPAISWAIVDYFGRPKLAYERLSNWYNPLLISLKFPVGRRWQAGEIFSAELWAINDSLHAYNDCELEITLDDRLVHVQPLDLPANNAGAVGTLTHRLTAPPGRLILALRRGHDLLARNHYDLDWFDESGSTLYPRLRRWLADGSLR